MEAPSHQVKRETKGALRGNNERVWPVTLANYLAWHGLREPVISLFCQVNKMEGLLLKRALATDEWIMVERLLQS